VLGPERDSVRPLPRSGRVTIGRSSDNDLALPDPLMSRHHAVLHLDGGVRLEDLGSENGTLLYLPPGENLFDSAGDTVPQATRHLRGQTADLNDGAIISLGATRLLVRRADEERSPAPVAEAPAAGERWIMRSPKMRAVWELAARAAATQINVLLLGETGVGKEVLAQRIHDTSPRAGKDFVRLNCAAFSETLLESELFGHEKGAFTGATTTKPGLFESADGGTILLDEVGELPLQLQGKLLRLLEERAVLRIGALRPRPVDVRIIAATNRDLERDIDAGTFRRDLYFRLNGLALVIPPLRERVEEIRPLAMAFAAALAERERRSVPEWSEAALARLERHAWPGNVRELRNVVERALVVAPGRIEPEHLPEAVVRGASPPPAAIVAAAPVADAVTLPSLDAADALRQRAEELDRDRIIQALEQCAWNQTKAAELLQMTRRALVIRLERYQIPRPRKRLRTE